jgi:hypothetical protein
MNKRTHIQGDSDQIGPRLTVIRQIRNEWLANMTFGPDAAFNINIVIDAKDVESHAPDGAERPCVRMTIGGIDDNDQADDQFARVFRAFNENELRWLAKMCLAAANECKRLENISRKKLGEKYRKQLQSTADWYARCQIVQDKTPDDGDMVWWAARSPDGQMYLCENDGKWKEMPQVMGGWFTSEGFARDALKKALNREISGENKR